MRVRCVLIFIIILPYDGTHLQKVLSQMEAANRKTAVLPELQNEKMGGEEAVSPLDEMARLSEDQQPRYIIVEAAGRKRLAKLVNAYIREGFLPQGGVVVLTEDIWAQAMVKGEQIITAPHKLTGDQRTEAAAALRKQQEGKPAERRQSKRDEP